jgi:GNAT superfamily N-acetyltransferase
VPPLLELLQRTHEQDGYPVRAEAVSGWWLASTNELASAVAVVEERVVGHVALHPAAEPADAVEQWTAATGLPADRLALVSRLFTDRSCAGAGTALLGHAVDLAAGQGRHAVLLVDPDSAARGFYVRRGWRQVGSSRQQWGHRIVDAVLMVAPAET